MAYKDPQKRKEYNKKYWERTKVSGAAKRKESRQSRKEKLKESKHKYYLENKEYLYEQKVERRDKNKKILLERLGGKCSHPECDETTNLHFDHKDPKTKSFTISHKLNNSIETLIPEVDKCQLLCPKHHLEKTRMEEHWKERERNELGQFEC